MMRITGAIVLLLSLAACAGGAVDQLPGPGSPIAGDGPPAVVSYSHSDQDITEDIYEGFGSVTVQDPTVIAFARGDLEVYQEMSDAEPALIIPWTTILGTTTVLMVVEEPNPGWLEVLLPIRPNGTTGYVRSEAVDRYVVDGKIVVDLSDRELTYRIGDSEILRTTVAVGSAQNPTPEGTFFVTDSVRVSASDGPWGPAALGLSARSDTITEYNGGDGIIGIHGTNRPSSIGEAASLGCVRLPNDVITELQRLVPIGTPVEIRA